jgi:HTH-type transcriptional regulator/antitoxin HipB
MQIIEIGDIVRYHRKKSGLSREDLAKIAGVGKTVVYDLENGKETIRLSTLNKIFKALNIKLSVDSPLMKFYMEQKNEKS